ncbi:MAG: invasin domain 3-containing protein, partial [Actinomycetota bacterium]
MIARTLEPRRLVALAALVVASLAGVTALVVLGGSDHQAPKHDTFVSKQLGRRSATATLERTPQRDVHVSVKSKSISVASGSHRVTLGDTTKGGEWTSYENGARRATPFGHETVVVTKQTTEQFLTVNRHLGDHDWSWNLKSLGLTPRVGNDGAVGFLDGHVLSNISIAAPHIYDGAGHDITPKGTQWYTANGKLYLQVDDSKLPTPYVIDPAITIRTSTFTGGAGTSIALTMPAGYRVGDVVVAQIDARSATATITKPAAFTQISTTQTNSTHEMGLYYRQIANGDATSYTFTLSASNEWAASLVVLAGVNGGTAPTVGTANRPTATSTTASDNATANVAANTLVLNSFAIASGTATASPYYSTAGGTTFIGNAQSTNGTAANRVSMAETYTFQTTAGAPTARSSTLSGGTASRTIGWQTAWPIDTTAPTTLSMTNPGLTLHGTVSLSGQATETNSSLDLVFQYSPAGANTWSTATTATALSGTSTSASWDTTGVADGFYDLRMVARNGAWATGDTDTASTTYTNVRVDNSPISGQTLTIQPLTGTSAQYFDSANNIQWYDPATTGGTFTVTSTPVDVSPQIALAEQASAQDGTAGPITINLPSTPASGTFMLLQVSYELGTGATIVVPSGWTLLTTQNVGTTWGEKVYYKTAGASEPTAVAVSDSASANANISGGITVWSGVSATNPIDVSGSGQTTTGTTNITSPSITTNVACDELVNFAGIWSSQTTVNAPSGMTEAYFTHTTEVGWDPESEAAYQTLGAAGATGTRVATDTGTGTASNGDKANAGIIVALRPQVCASEVDFPSIALTGFTHSADTDTIPAFVSSTYTWTTSSATEPGNQSIVAKDEAGNTPLTTTLAIRKDTVAPAFASAPTAGGYYNALASIPVVSPTATDAADNYANGSGVNAATYVLQRQAGTISGGTCTYSGGWTNVTLVSGQDTEPAEGCYHYREQVTDNVGNVGTSATSGDVVVDLTNPTSAGTLSFTGVTGSAYGSGTTLYYKTTGTAGGFTVVDTSPADAGSGIGKVRFPGLAGTSQTTQVDDSASPYQQAYSWASAISLSGAQTVSAFDKAGNSTGTTFTITADGSGPTIGATTFPTSGANYRSATYSTSWSGAVSDGGSGMATMQVSVKDPNGNYWNGSTFSGASETFNNATVGAGWTWTGPGLSTNGTYTVHLVATDNVGNPSTTTFTFVYDTAAPSFGTLALTKLGNCDSNVFLNGTTVYYNPTAACASAFTLTQPLSDTGGSGASSVQYPTTSGGVTHSNEIVASPFTSSAFGWSAGATTTGSQTLTGSDASGNTATTTFSFAKDTAGPVTAITAPTATAIKNGATLTATADDSTTGNAGVKQVEFRYCAGATCTYGSSTAITTVAVSPYTTTWSSQPADGTYTILARATDNVGNVTDVTKTVTVDNTAPAFSSAALNAAGTQLTITLTEAGSGLNTGISTAASAFTVLLNGSGDTVTGVTQVDATHIRLNLTNRAYDGNTVTVAYTQPGSNQEQDNAGNLMATFTAQPVATTAAASLSTSTVVASPTGITANGSSTSTITVTLKNGAGTALTSSGGTVTLTTTAGSLGAVTDNGNGTYTATLTSSTTANPSVTVSAKLDGSSLSNTASVAFNPGAATKLVFTQQPSSANAGASTGTIKVSVEDANNNVVTGDTSNVTVALTTPGGATLSGTKTVAAVAGVATFSGLSVDLANSYTLTATDGSLTSATSSSFTISPAAASKVVFTQQPSSANAGASTGTIKASVEDTFGNVVTGDTSNVTVALTTPGGATLSGTKTVAAVAGVATFTGLSVDLANAYTLTASDGALTTGTSSSFTISPAAASKVVFTQQPSNANAGASTGTIKASVEDTFGNVVTGDTSNVTVALTTPGGATLSGTKTVAAVAGVATFTGLSVDLANTYTLTASDGALTTGTSSSFTISPAAAAKVTFTQQPSNATAGTSIGTVKVAVQDSFGNTVTSDTSNVTVALTTPGGATLSGTKTVAAVAGVATFSGLSVDLANTYTLTASDGALTTGTSSSFTISPASASKLVFTQQPSNAASTASIGTPKVTVEDTFGNVVTTDTSNVTVALTTPGGATLSGTKTVAAVAGVATFGGLSVDKANTYTLTATDGSLASAMSSSFTISVGAAAKLAFTTQPSSSVNGGATLSTQPVVTVQDAGGNTVTTSSAAVTLALTTPAGATLTCTTNPQTASSGVTTFAGCSIDKAGAYTLTASSGALTTAVSSAITVNVGPAVSFSVTSATGTPTAGTPVNITVTVRDAGGNVVTGYTGTVHLTSTDGSAALPADYTFTGGDAGVHTFSVTLKTAGSRTVTATDTGNGTLNGTTPSLAVSPGAASKVVFTSTTSSVTSGATKTLTAEIRDANNNLETSDSSTVVTFAKTSGAGTVTGLGTATAANGVATLVVTGNAAGALTVTASSGALATDTSTFSVTPGAGTQVVFTSGTSSVASGATKTLTAAIEDANGNVVTSDNSTVVTFAKTSGTGTLSGLGNATPTNGVASLTVTGATAGSVTVTASAGALSSSNSTFSVTVGPAAKVVFTSGTTSVAAGANKTLTAEVRDANNNVETGDNSTVVTFAKTSGTGTVTGLGNATVSAGVATLTVTGGTAGSITVTASSGALTTSTSTFSVTTGTTTRVVFTSGTGSVTSGSTKTLTAQLQDAQGNLISSDNSTVITFSKTGGAGTVTGLGTATVSGGVATLNVTGSLAGSLTVTASSGSLTSDTSTFSVTTGAASKIVFTSGAGNVASGGTKSLTAALEDANGNVITSDSTTVITFAKNSGAGTVTGLGTATASSGVASLTVTGQVAGAITVGASSGALTSGSSSFNVVAGTADATTSTLSVSPGSITADGTSTSTVTIRTKDSNGNAITTGGDTIAVSTSRGSFPAGCVLACTPVDNGDGSYTVVLTSSTTAGTAAVTATLNGLPMTANGTVSFVPGPAAKVVITSGTASVASGSTKTLTAEVRDANNNLETSDSSTVVTFAKTSGAGTVTGLGTATAANGVASLTVTGQTAGSLTATASSGALSTDTSTFSVTPGPAAKLVITSSTGNLSSGTTRTLTAEVRDANDNLVTSDNSTVVAFAKTTGAGTASGLGNATASGGIASLTVTGQIAGAITIGATSGSLTAGSSSFTVVPGAAAAVVVTSNASSVASSSTKTLTAEVRDAAGNLRTSDNSTAVTFAKTSGAGTVTGLGTATAANGVASLTVTGKLAGAITIGASSGALTPDSTTFTVTPGPAAKVVVTSSTGNLTSGGTRTLTAEIRDANDNLVTSDNSTSVTFAKTSGAGTVTGLGAATASGGVVSLTVTGQTAGALAIGATSGSLTSDSTSFTIVPGAAAKVVVTSGTGNLASGATRTLTAEIRDASDNLVASDNSTVVTFAKTSGAGTVTGLGTATAANGIASLTVTGNVAGAIAIGATSGSLTSDSTSFTIVPGAAAKLAVTSNGSSVASGATKTLTVEVRDANDNLVTGDNSTSVAFAKSSGAGSVTGLGSATATNGVASLTVTGNVAGAIVVGATSGSLTSDSSSFTIVPGAAAKVVVTSGTGNLASGATRTLTAEIRDANDNLVTGDNSTSVTFAKTTGAGTVTGLGSATASGGIISLTVTGNAAGAIAIGATSGSLTSDSTTFTIVPGAAAKVVVTSSTADLSSGANRTLTAEIRDASDNLVSSDNSTVVTFAKTSGAGTVTGLATATAANGVASLTVTGKVAGAITIGATSGSLTSDSTTFNVVPGAAAKVVVTSGTGNLASGATRTLTAEIRDANDNLVTSDNSTVVTFAKTSGAGTVTGLGNATASNGVASLTVTGSVAGAITIGATSGSLTVDSTTFSVVPGAAAKIVVTSGTGNLASGATRTLTAEIRDANDNLVTSDNSTVVTFAQSGGAGTVGGLGTATAAGGVASLAVTGNVAGAIAIGATGGSLTSGSTSFTIVPGAAAKVVVTSSTANLTSGATRTLTAEVRDASDNLVTGDNSTSVTFAKTTGAGTVTGLGTATAANGVASLTVTGKLAGAITIGATSGSLTSDSTTFTIVPGSAAKVVVTSSGASLASGGTKTLTVEVRDANNNLVTSDNSTVVTLAQTGGTGTITGLGTATAANGVASLTVTGQTAGAITVGATSGSLTADSTSFNVVPAAASAATSTITVGSPTLTADGTSTTVVTVHAKDANGNTITTGGDLVTLSSSQGSLSSVTDNGDGTYTATLTAPTTVSTASIGGTLNGLPLTASATVGFVAGPAAKVVYTSGTANVASGSTKTLTVQIEDANGNVETGDSSTVVTFAKSSGAGTVTGLGTATAANGIASLTVTGNAAGAIVVGATSGSLTSDSSSFTIVPGAAAKVVVTSGTGNLASGATRTLTAEIRDANDNVETSDNSTVVTFAKTSGAGTVTGLGTATAANGIASLTVTGNVAGAISIDATSGSLTSGSTSF